MPDWISVKDILPQNDGAYLVFLSRYQYIDICWFAKDGEHELGGRKCVWYFCNSEFGNVATEHVTHWMPLPAPPNMNER